MTLINKCNDISFINSVISRNNIPSYLSKICIFSSFFNISSLKMFCSPSKRAISEFQLFLSTITTGMIFVGQRGATHDASGPLTFTMLRYIVGAVSLLVTQYPIRKMIDTDISDSKPPASAFLTSMRKSLPFEVSENTFDICLWGFICGIKYLL